MKKTTYLLGLTLAIGAIFTGCTKQDFEEPSQKESALNQPEKSEIALREKELNVTYFKKDVVISDKNGLNKIVMRFASLNQATLNEYLQDVSYELQAVSEAQMPGQQQVGTKSILKDLANSSKNGMAEKDYQIITEEVSQEFQKGVVGYWLNVKSKPSINARIVARDGYAYTSNHLTGEDWPERLHFIRNNAGPGNNIHYFLKIKNGGLFASWQTPSSIKVIQPVGQTIPNDVFLTYPYGVYTGVDTVYEIDGPKKVELVVDHNGYSDYSFFFQQM